jgi:hypothetical protein
VLALGRGGARETVSTALGRRTGMFFDTAEPQAIVDCVRSFVAQEDRFSRANARAQALQFSAERFRREFVASVERAIENSRTELDGAQPGASRITA